MSKNDGGTPSLLPDELDRALRRATDRTVSALTALRKAVLVHVNSERDRGISLEQVKLDIQEMVSRVHDGAVKQGDGNGEHDTISAEMIKWTDGFYKRSD
jgi:NADH dehydrogenase FAD-containing subunit